jgi:predicted PurR-regulated permease PerM
MLTPVAPPLSSPPRSFTQKALLATMLLVLTVLAWALSDVLVLIFGSIVLGVALRGLHKATGRYLRVPPKGRLLASLVLVALVLGGAGWLIGDALTEQLAGVEQKLPVAWQQFKAWLGQWMGGQQINRLLNDAVRTTMSFPKIANAAGATLGAVGSALLIVILAIYLCAEPEVYRRGLLKLCPPHWRGDIGIALDHAGTALGRWLVGQGISMAFLGVATTIGLALIGAPLALALGLITGLLCFVPFFGAVVAGVIAVLIAFSQSPQTALHVGLLFLGIQQAEEYLVTPSVQRWAIALPPAMTLISALVFGTLLGVLGAVFAAPLMVVAMTMVNDLFIRRVLEDEPLGERCSDL